MPKTPPKPAMPPKPQAPHMPGAPATLHVPMPAKMEGPFGQLTQVCHRAVPGEPHPAAFQIPPGVQSGDAGAAEAASVVTESAGVTGP